MNKTLFLGLFPCLIGLLVSCKSDIAPLQANQKKPTLVQKKGLPVKQTKTAPVTGVVQYMANQERDLIEALVGSNVTVFRQKNSLTLTLSGTNTFDQNSYNLEESALVELKKIAPVIRYYDKTRIKILGHTDRSGKPATNQLLSEKRADSVANVLEKEGISDARFWIEGKGSTMLISEKPTQAEKNNRIEIILTPTIM